MNFNDRLLHIQELANSREDWTERQLALPDWLRQRLERFQINGGGEFRIMYWRYELEVCELAALYYNGGGDVLEYTDQNGSTPNQLDSARELAETYWRDPDAVVKVPAAMTPLTGDPYYKGQGVMEP